MCFCKLHLFEYVFIKIKLFNEHEGFCIPYEILFRVDQVDWNVKIALLFWRNAKLLS